MASKEMIDSLQRLNAGGCCRLTISQDSFDEAVKENIDDFEMEFEEALQEAIAQFTMQGVDLRNIRKDDPTKRLNETQGVEEACENIRTSLGVVEKGGKAEDVKEALTKALVDLHSESEISDERRSMACNQGAVMATSGVLVWMLRDKDLVLLALEALASLLKLDLNREACRQPSTMAIMATINHYAEDAAVLEKAWLVVRLACYKFEPNKCEFDQAGVIAAMVSALKAHEKDPLVVKPTCAAMRQLVLRDDLREASDQCFDRARALNEGRALQEACKVLRNFQEDEKILPIILSTLACTAMNKENVDTLVACETRDLTIMTLRANPDKIGVVKDCCFLLGSLAQNDDQKKIIGQGDGMALIFGAMNTHRADSKVLAKAMKALINITLRMPENCTRIAETGGIPLVMDLMRAHGEKQDIQAHCCTIIRNLVARNQELVPLVLDEGAEEMVRRASAIPRCNELAFNALRDLHCELTFKEEWKGDIGYEKRLEQGDGQVEDPDFKELVETTKEQMAEATGLARFAT